MNIQHKMALIEPIVRAVSLELERLGEQHSCIFATAVLIDVLKINGYDSCYPLTVKPIVANPAAVTRIKSGEQFPHDPMKLKEWESDGCAFVTLGVGQTTSKINGWPGHLVAVVPDFFDDRSAICDLTITQASKPEWDIHLQPLFIRVPDTFIAGSTEFKPEVNGSLVIYKAFPEDRTYETAPIWTNLAYRHTAVTAILASLRQSGPTTVEPYESKITVSLGRKVGRNDPCPCGSGLKHKRCHGR